MSEAVILLVEDDPDDVELTRRALRKSGIRAALQVANDGTDALRRLHAAQQDPDHVAPRVVLLDLNLPRLGGLEVLERIRADARTRTVPVVVLTSSLHESDLRGAYDRGANSYVRKPVDFAEFTDAAAALAHYWVQLNRTAPET